LVKPSNLAKSQTGSRQPSEKLSAAPDLASAIDAIPKARVEYLVFSEGVD
jgi:hypothetical protein